MSENEQTQATETEESTSSVNLSPKIKELIASIETMTVLELSELVKSLEEKFGVSAVSLAPAALSASSTDAAASQTEEKTSFDVILTAIGDKKIAVIKAVRELTGLGLKEAKDIVDSFPNKPIKKGVKKEEAESIKESIEKAGGEVEIK